MNLNFKFFRANVPFVLLLVKNWNFPANAGSIFERYRETISIYVVVATFDRSDLHDYRATVVGRKSTVVSMVV